MYVRVCVRVCVYLCMYACMHVYHRSTHTAYIQQNACRGRGAVGGCLLLPLHPPLCLAALPRVLQRLATYLRLRPVCSHSPIVARSQGTPVSVWRHARAPVCLHAYCLCMHAQRNACSETTKCRCSSTNATPLKQRHCPLKGLPRPRMCWSW